ncbi:MAG: fumarylacetoacetate hydrolase family protein [Bdellovibrionia bacterium]
MFDKFICVGKNYHEHAQELGDPVPEAPLLFLKPPSSGLWVEPGRRTSVVLPQAKGVVHYECEIIARLNSQGQIEAVSLGLDMTLRDVQGQLKKQGHPWELGKVFRHAAVVGPWIEVSDFKTYLEEPFTFALDGEIRQRAMGREMRHLPQKCIQRALEFFPLVDGDILFTGTPMGVGGVVSGQRGELRWGSRLGYEVLFE